MRTVIFDLDGTLVDTGADLIAAANACFPEEDGPLDPVADKAVAFRGARAMLRLALARLGTGDESTVDRLYPLCLDHYGANIDAHSTFYPGALDAVAELRRDGYAVGICTNKPFGLADLLLTRMGARTALGPLVGADSLAVRKPDPRHFWEVVDLAGGARSRAMLVGDTVTDRDTGRAAGVPVALVTFGPTGRDVADLAPDALLDSYDDLGSLAARLLA